MKIASAVLAKKIKEVKGFVPQKTTMEALYSLLVKDGYLIASNTEQTVMVILEGVEGTTGSFLLPPQAYNVLVNMTAGDTEIKVDDNHTLSVTSGRSRMRFSSMDPSAYSFDIDSKDEGKASATISAEVLKNAITRILFATDESGAAGSVPLEVISIETKDGFLNVCGMSKPMVAWSRVPYEGELKMMLPISAAKNLVSLDMKGDVTVIADAKTAKFKTEGRIFQCRLMEGSIMDYQTFFGELPVWAGIDRQEVLQIAKRVSTLAKDEKKPICLDFNGDALKLSYMSSTSVYEESVFLTEPSQPGSIVIGLDPKLLSEVLKAFPEDDVRLNFASGAMPVIATADGSGMKVLLLPVLIQA